MLATIVRTFGLILLGLLIASASGCGQRDKGKDNPSTASSTENGSKPGEPGAVATDPSAGTLANPKTIRSREEFKKKIIGKTKEELEQLLGTPDNRSQDGEDEYWSYHNRSRDTSTNEIDFLQQVVMRNGIVKRVIFGPKSPVELDR